MSGLKAPINTCCRLTTLINNPPIPRIALCVYLYNPLFSYTASLRSLVPITLWLFRHE
jgi:hypothetical protein